MSDDVTLLDPDPAAGFLMIPSQQLLTWAPETEGALNPFVHFGQPSVWPRGLPLEEVSRNHPQRVVEGVASQVLIQQGMVNGESRALDPVFRLTRASRSVTHDKHLKLLHYRITHNEILKPDPMSSILFTLRA